jgi:fermentation-respiration switch protein FrsA (DUF1100 family)
MTRMDLLWILARIVLALAALKLFVWWLEPRMAFFPSSGVQETPAAAGVPFSDVRIATPDGETLHAWWIEHPAPRAQVVFFHGNGGNLSMWLDVFVELRRRGFSVLAVDYRGYGASTGRPTELGLYRDGDAAVRLFEEKFRRGGVPLIFWGRSIGAPVAAHAASVIRPDALVLETPMPDVRSVLRSNPVLWALSFLASYRFPTARLLAPYDGPLLVVHGESDEVVPFDAGRHVYESAPTSRKTFVAVPGAGHNDLHLEDPALYWAAVDRFVMSLSGR